MSGSTLVGSSSERLGRLLVELVRRPNARTSDVQTLLDQVPADRLVDHACYHRVPGVVYRSLCQLGVDSAELRRLRSVYQMATISHDRCLVELRTVAEVLADRTWMIVKGPILVEVGYGDPGARLYEDLDIVVPASGLTTALAGIEAAGGHVTDLNWPMMVKLQRAEVPMILPYGMLADLHWDLLVTPNIRARFSVPMDELLERRRIVRVAGIDVPTLEAVDCLLYLCLHGSLSGGDQLVWLKDLEQMIDVESTDWDELVRRAARYGVGLVAAMQLERARVVLGARVPESVPGALAGHKAWWRWWRARERQVGMARWGAIERSDGRFVSATSAGSVSSAIELARTVASDMAVHYFGNHRRSGDGPQDVPALYRPEDAGDSRTHYLELASTGPRS